ncbi:SDR family NAD(P)-dependent oxidoreductase [Pediococcus siamensis]|uniref:SDR family NAD(P)-dependent oxidoreductase n=1 Tax=Pediococcus siamensis TaxID=381829 RepID=UPI0039A30C56
MSNSTVSRKTAVLSGVTYGIGVEVTLKLVAQGYNICLLTHRATDARNLKNKIVALGKDCEIYLCNVDDSNEINNTYQKIMDRFGQIDLVFTNMGLMPDSLHYPKKPVYQLTTLEWRNYLETTLMGVINSTDLAAKVMKNNMNGGLIFATALYGMIPKANYGLYVVSRSAIRALIETVNIEFEKINKPVNAYLMAPEQIKDLPNEVIARVRTHGESKINF